MLQLPNRLFGLVAAGLFSSVLVSAQISGLCNTGQTQATVSGCTGVLVPPAAPGTNTNYDGNWSLGYFTFSSLSGSGGTPTTAKGAAWVNNPDGAWLPNSSSSASEWISPYAGDVNLPAGWYIYRTTFPVPALLPGGGAPSGVAISGRLASDNFTYSIYLESPAGSGQWAEVAGQKFPVTPAGGNSSYSEWWPFSFTNANPITPGADAALYIVVQNQYDVEASGPSPTALRVEFSGSSTFN